MISESKGWHIESLLENNKAKNPKQNASSFINCPIRIEARRLQIVFKGVPDVRPVENAKALDAGLSNALTEMKLEGSETGLETSYLVAGHVEGLGMQRDPEPVASHTQLPERPPTADLAVLA